MPSLKGAAICKVNFSLKLGQIFDSVKLPPWPKIFITNNNKKWKMKKRKRENNTPTLWITCPSESERNTCWACPKSLTGPMAQSVKSTLGFQIPTLLRRERRSKTPLSPKILSESESESTLSHSQHGWVASARCCCNPRVSVVYIAISAVRAAIGPHQMHRGRHKSQCHDGRQVQRRQP